MQPPGQTQAKGSMESIPIFRGSHLRPYLDALNEFGVPVETHLARADLPSGATARAGHYLPLRRAIECLDGCAREKGIDDLPLRGALRCAAHVLKYAALLAYPAPCQESAAEPSLGAALR